MPGECQHGISHCCPSTSLSRIYSRSANIKSNTSLFPADFTTLTSQVSQLLEGHQLLCLSLVNELKSWPLCCQTQNGCTAAFSTTTCAFQLRMVSYWPSDTFPPKLTAWCDTKAPRMAWTSLQESPPSCGVIRQEWFPSCTTAHLPIENCQSEWFHTRPANANQETVIFDRRHRLPLVFDMVPVDNLRYRYSTSARSSIETRLCIQMESVLGRTERDFRITAIDVNVEIGVNTRVDIDMASRINREFASDSCAKTGRVNMSRATPPLKCEALCEAMRSVLCFRPHFLAMSAPIAPKHGRQI